MRRNGQQTIPKNRKVGVDLLGDLLKSAGVVRNEFVVQAQGLSKHFGKTWAVRNLSLHISRHRITCLLGPSASGKTTLIRLMLGIYAPDGGRLTVLGWPSTGISRSHYDLVGYMPQFFVLYPHLNILENLTFVARLHGLPFWRSRPRIQELLEFLELWGDRRTLAKELSGGMQRRVALAAALIHKPEVLFLDEPTAGLDPILRAKLWDEFRRLNEDGTTLIVTTQYVSEAQYADQVALLSKGQLVADDTPAQLRDRAFGGDVVEVATRGESGFTSSILDTLRKQDNVVGLDVPSYRVLRFTLKDGASTLPRILEFLRDRGFEIQSSTTVNPTFDEVFVRLVEGYRASATEPEPDDRAPNA